MEVQILTGELLGLSSQSYDFNILAMADEKKGGSKFKSSVSNNFIFWINNLNLYELVSKALVLRGEEGVLLNILIKRYVMRLDI